MIRQASAFEHPDHYKEAGVDTDEADAGLQRLTARITRTWPAPQNPFGVKLPIGQFANIIDFGNGVGVAISTDGVGSKALIAHALGKYDTIGIDCVAMNVNDIICVGAKPVSMVDYVAIEEVKADVLDSISVGLCKGAEIAGISISGGETAQLKDMVNGFDLAGTAIGYVALDKVLVGQNIQDGDVLIGVESNGIHSNGLSMARRALLEVSRTPLTHKFSELTTDVGTELLRPTHIYVREAMDLVERISSLRALVHITSDGFLNLTRLKRGIGYVIDALPPVPPIFDIIRRLGRVEEEEMFSVFNMGIGFCAVVGAEDATATLTIFEAGGFRPHVIGHAVADETETVKMPQFGLRGRGKHFWST
jgi:phosphoribosylformylglycinamidine cyclo-ligase